MSLCVSSRRQSHEASVRFAPGSSELARVRRLAGARSNIAKSNGVEVRLFGLIGCR